MVQLKGKAEYALMSDGCPPGWTNSQEMNQGQEDQLEVGYVAVTEFGNF